MSWQKLLAMNPLESSSSGRVEVPPWLNPLMSTMSFLFGYDFMMTFAPFERVHSIVPIVSFFFSSKMFPAFGVFVISRVSFSVRWM